MRDSIPHQHTEFQKIPTVRSSSKAPRLQHIFGSTRDREFPIANSGSILTRKDSISTLHAMDDMENFLHRLAGQIHHDDSAASTLGGSRTRGLADLGAERGSCHHITYVL